MRKLFVSITIAVICLTCFLLPVTAEATPLKVEVFLNKDEVNAGEEITATFNVSGGRAPYECFGLWSIDEAGSSIVSDGEYFSFEDTLSFTPRLGESVKFIAEVTDADGRSIVKSSDSATIVGSPVVAPLTMKIVLDKHEVALGEQITASFIISGGRAPYKCFGLWSTEEAGSSISSDGVTFTAEDTLNFTPELGDSVKFIAEVTDADGRSIVKSSDSAAIVGSPDVAPLTVKIVLDKPKVAVGEQISASLIISGGRAPYKCFGLWSIEDAGSTKTSDGTFFSATDTLSYTPELGDSIKFIAEIEDADKRRVVSSSTKSSIIRGVIRGDANDDKIVDFKDLFELIEYLAGGPECASMENANANSDPEGVVDVLDAVWLIDYLVGD